MDVTASITQLIAKDQIRDATLRYCRGIDRCDVPLAASAYWPDAIDEHGSFNGNGHEFVAYAIGKLRNAYDATQHLIANHHIELVGDDHATGEIYNVSAHRTGDTMHTWWGRYLDRYERRGDEWRIVHRICVHEWTHSTAPLVAMPIVADRFAQGGDDRGRGG
jgi:ketosteroid isomerase-like protein